MGIRRLGRPAGYNYPTGLSAIITETSNSVVDYLVVAGGGSGSYISGGGGAGGFLTGSGHPLSQSTPYTVTVGSGGSGSATSGAGGSGIVIVTYAI